MKKKIVLCVALTALIATFFGCSNMLNTTVSNDSVVSEMPIQISLAKEAGRYVKAVEDWSIASNVYAWKVKFTEESTGATEIGYWDNNYTITHDEKETITVVYNSETKTFGMSKVATGTYTLEIMSTSTSDTFTVYGKTTGFVIDSGKTNSKTMFVDLKRETTGNLSLSFPFSGNITSTDINGKLKAVLTPLTGDGDTKEYTASTEESAEFKATLDDSSNVTDLELKVSSLNSGFYKLSFTDLNTDTKYKYWVSSDCQVIEIADDTTTTESVSLNRSTEKNYFATNNSANVGYNGLSASSPDEINELLTSFTTELPKNSYINVYMDSSVPVIEASTIKTLQTSLGNNTDYEIAITVYQSQSSSIVPSLIIETAISDSTTTVNTYIHGDVAIKAADDVTDVTVTKIGNITSINDFTDINAKLVDGATITTTEITGMGDYKLYLSAETSAGVDNLSAYTASPMLTISNDESSTASTFVEIKSDKYKARFDTTSTDAGTVTSVYAQLVGSGETSITEFAASASIAATASDATTTNYTTGAVIPYSSDAVTFSLSGVTSEITAYSWLLNSNTVGSDSTMSLIPTKSKYVDLDGTNTVSLSVQINGTWYLTEFTFTFSSTDYSRAVYITTDSYDSPNGFYEADYANASSGTSLDLTVSNSSPAFTFDNSQNLWIVKKVSSDSSYYLQLIKQTKVISSSSFKNTTLQCALTGITFTNLNDIDITYDTKNKLIYVLATESTTTDSTTTYTTKIYAFDPTTLTASTTNTDSNVTIDTSTWSDILTAAGITTSVDFTKIAVNDTTVYLADAAYNVFKLTNFTTTATPTFVKNLATELSISDDLTLTDMQIGDGFGNDTENLYVLMRQHSKDINPTSDKTYYSRGALCKIDSTNTVTSYGFSTTTTADTIHTSKTINFYTPSESSTTEFYGPRYFAAICPKKLVIADDGFYYTNTEDNGSLTNKDGFLEFDINATENQLSRTSAEVEISIPNSTDYTKTNYN